MTYLFRSSKLEPENLDSKERGKKVILLDFNKCYMEIFNKTFFLFALNMCSAFCASGERLTKFEGMHLFYFRLLNEFQFKMYNIFYLVIVFEFYCEGFNRK